MTIFVLKMIAALTMLLDHTTDVFRAYMSPETCSFLRGIGRIAFPLYLFMLLEGVNHTRSIERYISKILYLAAVSQIPYSIVFETVKPPSFFHISTIDGAFVIFIIGCIVMLAAYKSFLTIPVGVASIFVILRVSWNGHILLGDELNILYAFAATLIILYALKQKTYITVLEFLCYCVTALSLAYLADAGITCILIGVLCFYLSSSQQSTVFILISILVVRTLFVYNMPKYYVIFILISGLLMLMYNGKLGPDFKKFFYYFYPGHLILLAITHILVDIA